MGRLCLVISTIALAISLSSTVGFAGVISSVLFVPTGLNPGDTYHIAFITNGAHNALSSDIAGYNAFVQSQAEEAGAITESWGVEWNVIGSTASVTEVS